MVTDSVVVFVGPRRAIRRTSRPGTTSCRTGVEVITPNPFTSGGAQWNLMAAYGAQLEQGKTEEEAVEYLAPAARRTRPCRTRARVSRCRPSRAARATSCSPTRTRRSRRSRRARPIDYVVPDQTILIENPVAVTVGRAAEQAQAFVDFLQAPGGAEDLRREGLPARSTRTSSHEFDYPQPLRPLHDRRRGRLGCGHDEVLRPRERASSRRSSRSWGSRLSPAKSFAASV